MSEQVTPEVLAGHVKMILDAVERDRAFKSLGEIGAPLSSLELDASGGEKLARFLGADVDGHRKTVARQTAKERRDAAAEAQRLKWVRDEAERQEARRRHWASPAGRAEQRRYVSAVNAVARDAEQRSWARYETTHSDGSDNARAAQGVAADDGVQSLRKGLR